MRRRRRETGGAGWFVLVSVVAVFAALWTWTAPGRAENLAPAGSGVELHLLDNGFHTDLAVPRAALEARAGPLAEAVRALPPGDWILIGWGDAKFYVDQSPMTDRLPDGARAFFKRGNPSVVMLDPAQSNPIALFAEDGRRTFRLTPAGFDALADHVEASLALTDGHATVAAARPNDDARFYASREHFWIGHLCNHWTSGVLNAGGLPMRPFASITSAEVMAGVDRGLKESGS